MDGVVFEPQFCTHNGTFCKQAHNDYHYFSFKLTSSQSRPGHTVVKSIHSFGAAPIHWCWRDVKVCMFASLTLQTFFDPYKNRKKLRELFAVTQFGYLHYYTSVLYTVYTMYFLAYFLPLRNQNCEKSTLNFLTVMSALGTHNTLNVTHSVNTLIYTK